MKNWLTDVTIEKMDMKNVSTIYYHFYPCRFGDALIASTDKGVCFIGFADEDAHAAVLNDLQRRFPFTQLTERKDEHQRNADAIINHPTAVLHPPLHLHVKGTDFQMQIWKKLLQIGFGKTTSYSSLVDDKRSARAAGTAVGDNPVSYIVPCHRVIRADGTYHNYYWGPARKIAMIGWEAKEYGTAAQH
jgi:AraC family transcriptional regulator, regulatory protein of adaptative response / methylated-DNA-[protein]-cysteine methyltransferase